MAFVDEFNDGDGESEDCESECDGELISIAVVAAAVGDSGVDKGHADDAAADCDTGTIENIAAIIKIVRKLRTHFLKNKNLNASEW